MTPVTRQLGCWCQKKWASKIAADDLIRIFSLRSGGKPRPTETVIRPQLMLLPRRRP